MFGAFATGRSSWRSRGGGGFDVEVVVWAWIPWRQRLRDDAPGDDSSDREHMALTVETAPARDDALGDAGVPQTVPQLVRAMGFRDLVLFYIVACFSVQWIATAAIAGPSAIVVWLIACLAFAVPLVFTVRELSSRYPGEGGLYLWSKQTFGGFAGFTTAWTYWGANLPYFSSLLYFTAANALHLAGPHAHALSASRLYFIGAPLLGLGIAGSLNIVGLNVSKWLHNIGAVGLSLPAAVLIVLSTIVWSRFGSATPFDRHALIPEAHLKDVIFWSTVAFSISGLESASMLGDEVQNPRRNIPRALAIASVIVIATYILSTASVLVALPHQQVTVTTGFLDAIYACAHRLNIGWIAVAMTVLVIAGGVGQCGAWCAAAARLPFVAGIDRYLPAIFGRIHPRWGTPHVALLVQLALSSAFIFLSQVGTTVESAYNILISVSVIVYFIPYLFMFAAMIRIQSLPTEPEVLRVPGGPRVGVVLASLGFATTALSMVFALMPAPQEPHKLLAVVKVVGSTALFVGAGVLSYLAARRRLRSEQRP
jgi:glutamate:GABA antiporter